jgi:hypothetical protein
MTQDKSNMDKKDNKAIKPQTGRDGIYIAIIILLLLSNGFLGYLYFTTNTKLEEVSVSRDDAVTEREEYRGELMDMLAEYENIETNNEELRQEIEAEREKIQELLKKIDLYKYDVYKLKKETETLRTIMKGLYVQVDSLNTLNKQLEAENLTIKEELTSTKSEKEELKSKTKNMEQIINVGSVLQATDILSGGIKIKSNGKQVETDRIRRTDMIKSCFRITENKIAKKGDRTLYMRVITPDGKVLSDGTDKEFTFKFDGVEGLFSAKRKVTYDNKEMEMCIFYDLQSQGDNLPSGEYISEIYEEGNLIGISKFELK